MPRAGAFLILGLMAVTPAGAQRLDDLRTPPSPGFAILGLSPNAIERPTTPVALGLGFVSAAESGSLIPESYAVEFSPYWLTPKPLLTFSEVHRPSFWQGLKQSFAISVATDRDGSVVDGTRLGLGARVQVLPGRPSLRTDAAADSLDTLLSAILDLAQELEDTSRGPDSSRLQARMDSLENRERRLREDFQSRQWADRDGVRWELAGAFASAFPSNTFARGDLTAWGVWSTFSLRPTARDLDVLALLRYQRLDAPSPGDSGEPVSVAEGQAVLDAGVRILYGSGPLLVSAELLGRSAFAVARPQDAPASALYDDSYRVAGSVEYRVGQNAALQWTFGRGFALAGQGAGALISLIGLKWALGEGPTFPLG
jgi:hypothetical protein